MTVAEKLVVTLPVDPRVLVDTEPMERGRAYNDLDLDFRQRGAVEEALRMCKDGTYPGSEQ